MQAKQVDLRVTLVILIKCQHGPESNMASIGEPYVYTDVPEPLDDIEIKQDGDGFEIRLNEAAYLYSNANNNATNGEESENSDQGYDGSHLRRRRRSSPNKFVLRQNQCDDDVEVVEAKKGKRKTRATKTTKPKTPDIPDMSLNLRTPRDNIFERMWNVEDVVEKSKMRQSSVPPVKVKEEKIEVIICDTDENTQSGEQEDNEDVVEYSSKRAKVKNRRTSFASGISDVNSEKTINLVTPSHGASSVVTETQNGEKTETPPVINVLASDEEISNTEERNPDPVDFTLTKYDLIKMRRAKAKSTTANDTINVGRNSKGKQPKCASSETLVIMTRMKKLMTKTVVTIAMTVAAMLIQMRPKYTAQRRQRVVDHPKKKVMRATWNVQNVMLDSKSWRS